MFIADKLTSVDTYFRKSTVGIPTIKDQQSDVAPILFDSPISLNSSELQAAGKTYFYFACEGIPSEYSDRIYCSRSGVVYKSCTEM